MKKILLGFIIGALLMTSIPISAAIQEYVLYKADYKLMINGVEYTDEELPLLNYKGYTYAPVRSVFEAAGLKVDWTGGMAVVTTPEPEPKEEKGEAEPPATETEPTEPTEPEESKDESSETPSTPTTPTIPNDTEPQPEPEKPKTRTTTLVYDGSKCSCGITGRLANSRTIYEGGQEYDVCDVYCINPKCILFNKLIGQVKWRVEYK